MNLTTLFQPPTFFQVGIFFLTWYLLHRLLQLRPLLLPWNTHHPVLPNDSTLRKVKTISHRGGRETTIENTMSSFRNAYNCENMNMIELDVHLTKDKQVVVFHDNTLTRMTNDTNMKNINQVDYKDLPLLTGQWENANKRALATSEKIPLFTKVLDSIPHDICVIVEIKPQTSLSTKELVKLTDDILRARPTLTKRVLWFSLHANTCNVLLPAQNPFRPRITAARDVAIVVLANAACLLPFIPSSFFPEVVGCVAPSSISNGLLRRVPFLTCCSDRLLNFLKGWIQPMLVSKSMVEHMQRRGKLVFMLGVNDDVTLGLSQYTGCDAVLSDRVEWLSEAMKEPTKKKKGSVDAKKKVK